jgi:uncharacterized membrane protein
MLMYFSQMFAVLTLAFASAPFGIPAIVFWMYVCAALVFFVGIVRIVKELPMEHGLDKVMPFGGLFFAIPMAVFGTEHFTDTADIAGLVPSWIPAHTFWVYAVGLGFICAGFAIAARVQARLAAALVGMTMFIFVGVMDVPAVVAEPHNRIFWALMLRELAFGSGGLALALTEWPRRASGAKTATMWAAFPRCFVGIASLFYGVEHLLHPYHVPGVPLERISPVWIPGRIFLSYFVGVVLMAAGACLLVNKKTRIAATILGLTILLTMFWIYLPMLIAAPLEVETLNYFFDTLLFCGTVLLVADLMEKEKVVLGG